MNTCNKQYSMIKKLLPFLFLASLFGVGCSPATRGPVGVSLPDARQIAATKTVQFAAGDVRAETVISSSTVALLRLNDGGAGTVTRGTSTVAIRNGIEIACGDEIRVTAGTVSIVYPGAGVSRLVEGTNIILLSGSDDSGKLFSRLILEAGSVWTRFERLFGPAEEFSVQAGDVVATVRGTAFGVSLDGVDVDIQVAEHAVEVGPAVGVAAKPVSVHVGQGVRAHGRIMSGVRPLSSQERSSTGYLFGATKIPAADLNAPAQVYRISNDPVIPTSLLNTVNSLQRTYVERAKFAQPEREPRAAEGSPRGTPSVQGPR